MGIPYTGSLGINLGPTDHHGCQLQRATMWNLTQSLANSLGDTPQDGALGYRTDLITTEDSGVAAATKKHLVYYDTADGGNEISVLRPDCTESIRSPWAFVRSGSNPPFTANQTLPAVASTATMVTNLNANYLQGYVTSTSQSNQTIPVYYTSGRLLVGTPVAANDAVTKAYADALGSGINPAADGPVNAATTAAIADLSAASVVIDGVTLVAGNRVLVKNTASPDGIVAASHIYDGIYTVGTVTAGTAPFTRATDSDTTAEVDRQYVFVSDGTVNQGSSYFQTVNDPVLGTDALNWALFYQAVAQNAGNGIDITGNLISVLVSGSTTYTAGGILYHGSTSTISSVALTGILQGNGSSAPTRILPGTTATVTSGTLSMFSSSSPYLTDSLVTQSGGVITVTGGLTVTGTTTLATGLTGSLKAVSGVVSAVTGATNNITFWSDANTLSADSNFTWSASTLTVRVDTAGVSSPITIQNFTAAATDLGVGIAAKGVGAASMGRFLWAWEANNNDNTYFALHTRLNDTEAIKFSISGAGVVTVTNLASGALTSVSGVITSTVAGTTANQTAGTIPKFSSSSPFLVNSIMSESGTTITIGGGITFTGAQTIQTSSGILTVTGTGGLTLSTAANTNALLNVGTGNFAVNTDQFFVHGASGNVVIGGNAPSGYELLGVKTASGAAIVYSFNIATQTTAAFGLNVQQGFGGTQTTAANSDELYGVRMGQTHTTTHTSVVSYGFAMLNTTGTGTITTRYNFYLETPTRGSTNWQIYSLGGNSAFGGNTRFGGVTAPVKTVDITGTLQATGITSLLGTLGVAGTAITPGANIESLATTEQLRLSYDASNYTSFTVASAGQLTITPLSNGSITLISGSLDIKPTYAVGIPGSATIKGSFIQTGSTYSTMAQIILAKENTNDNDNAGSLALYTRTNGGSSSARLTISSTGTVAIPNLGTTAKMVQVNTSSVLIASNDLPAGSTIGAKPIARGYAVNLTSVSTNTFTVTHNLNTLDVIVQIVLISTGETWGTYDLRTGVNTVTITFGYAPADNVYRVLITAVS